MNRRAAHKVFNPGRCQDCPNMWCRVFYPRTQTLKGWCCTMRRAVTGHDLCHLPREPTLPFRELFEKS